MSLLEWIDDEDEDMDMGREKEPAKVKALKQPVEKNLPG